MTDFDESMYEVLPPSGRLCREICALARRENGGYGVIGAQWDDGRVCVIVSDERARRRVLELYPEAEVTVL